MGLLTDDQRLVTESISFAQDSMAYASERMADSFRETIKRLVGGNFKSLGLGEDDEQRVRSEFTKYKKELLSVSENLAELDSVRTVINNFRARTAYERDDLALHENKAKEEGGDWEKEEKLYSKSLLNRNLG